MTEPVDHLEQPFSHPAKPSREPMPREGSTDVSFSDRPEILEDIQRMDPELVGRLREAKKRTPLENAQQMANQGLNRTEIEQLLQSLYPDLHKDPVELEDVLKNVDFSQRTPREEAVAEDAAAGAEVKTDVAAVADEEDEFMKRIEALTPEQQDELAKLNGQAAEVMKREGDERIEGAKALVDQFKTILGTTGEITWRTALTISKVGTGLGIVALVILVLFFLAHAGKAGGGQGG